MKKPVSRSLLLIIRYRIERFLDRGGASIFVALLILQLILIIALLGLRYTFHFISPTDEINNQTVGSQVFRLFLEFTDPSNMAQLQGKNSLFMATGIVAGLFGIALTSLLTALFTTELDKKLKDFQKGKTQIVLQDHLIILGWNSRIFDVIFELNQFFERERKIGHVVILADRSKETMELELFWRLKNIKHLKMIVRSGQPTLPGTLEKLNVAESSNIIVLSSCEELDPASKKIQSDTSVIKTCFALKAATQNNLTQYIAPELFNLSNASFIHTAIPDRALIIDKYYVLSQLMVQTTLSNGLSSVYYTLLSFHGAKLCISQSTNLGKYFGEIIYHLKDGTPIGFIDAHDQLTLNPAWNKIVPENARIVLIADKDPVKFEPNACIKPAPLLLRRDEFEQKPHRILTVGVNCDIDKELLEFDHYLKPGSEITVVLHEQEELLGLLEKTGETLINTKLNLLVGNPLDDKFLDSLLDLDFDIISVMQLTLEGTNEEIDAETIKLLLGIKKYYLATKKQRPMIVTEVLNTENESLFQQLDINDYVLSSKLISMLFSQLTIEPHLKSVYSELLSKSGTEIYIKPAVHFFQSFNQNFRFIDLYETILRSGETLIGIQFHEGDLKGTKQILNPPKNTPITLSPKDGLILLSNNFA